MLHAPKVSGPHFRRSAVVRLTEDEIPARELIDLGLDESFHGVFGRADNRFAIIERGVQHDGNTGQLLEFRYQLVKPRIVGFSDVGAYKT